MAGVYVVISSTAIDLPEHRRELLDACLRQGAFPLMMEHLPASPRDAITESLALVDRADIYLGVFGHRYGWIPSGHEISITEMEYQRAIERQIPRLIFFMHEDHPITVSQVDIENAQRLRKFKERIQQTQVVSFFHSPADLRAQVIDSLSRFRRPDLQAFHFVSDIPAPPEPYIAHPYTLLQTKDLVGRQAELNLLTDWVADAKSEISAARVLVLVAMGGMGKSALIWKWFKEVAPQEMSPLAGRLWWSFYESDATFENFVIRALAYVKGISRSETRILPPAEREEELLNLLNQRPYLLALDGLERIMIAYARMDAASMPDDDLDERSENAVVGALGAQEFSAHTSRHRLRKTADPRAGTFLRKLAQVSPSKILVSTRLYPAELQTETGAELPGSRAAFLGGLKDDDALNLWRAFGVSGSRENLVPIFRSFGNYPLVIRALAGEVAQFRPAPGDFDKWRTANPSFAPLSLPLIQRRSHVLSFAFRGLTSDARRVLLVLAAFRMPSSYDTLVALLVKPEGAMSTEQQLDRELANLEDRGLLGWDRRANRYDLHPVVRGVTWQSLGRVGQRIIYENLQSHLESLPFYDKDNARSLDDLTPAIELYSTLIGLRNYDTAYEIFSSHLLSPALFRLSLCRQASEWLELLFPNGLDRPAALSNPDKQRLATWNLAYSYHYAGNLKQATRLCKSLIRQYGPSHNAYDAWSGLGCDLCLMGKLRQAEHALREALRRNRLKSSRAVILGLLGDLLSVRGLKEEAESLLRQSLEIHLESPRGDEHDVFAYTKLSHHEALLGNTEKAYRLASEGWYLAHSYKWERALIAASYTLGEALLAKGDLEEASAKLHLALSRARAVDYLSAEIGSLLLLTELQLVRGDFEAVRECLDDLWDPLESGPFRLDQATAFNILGETEKAQGNRAAAVEAAKKAFRLAWCDGPPFAMSVGLKRAKDILAVYEEAEPDDLPTYTEGPGDPLSELIS